MRATYPVGDAAAGTAICSVATCVPSWYKVTVRDDEPEATVSTASCQLPSSTTFVHPLPSAAVLPTCPSRQPLELTHNVSGSPPVPVPDDRSVAPPLVALNHSSADSAPVPAKYPPGMLI